MMNLPDVVLRRIFFYLEDGSREKIYSSIIFNVAYYIESPTTITTTGLSILPLA